MKEKLQKAFFDPVKLPKLVGFALRVVFFVLVIVITISTGGNLYESIRNSDDIFDLKYDYVRPLEKRVEELENLLVREKEITVEKKEIAMKESTLVGSSDESISEYDGYVIEAIGCPEGMVYEDSYIEEGFLEASIMCVLPEFENNHTHIPFIRVEKLKWGEGFFELVRNMEGLNVWDEVYEGPRPTQDCEGKDLESCSPIVGIFDYDERKVGDYNVVSYNAYGVSGMSNMTIVERNMSVFVINNHLSAQCDLECNNLQTGIYNEYVKQFTSFEESLIFLK